MGAQFDTGIARGKDLESAMRALVEQKCWNYGHAGYSGTLAEKDDVIELPVPPGFEGREWVELVEGSMHDDWTPDTEPHRTRVLEARAKRQERLGAHADTAREQAAKLDGDKWGPAFAIKIDDGEWWVGGFCSS